MGYLQSGPNSETRRWAQKWRQTTHGCSHAIRFPCPATMVAAVTLRAPDRARERARSGPLTKVDKKNCTPTAHDQPWRLSFYSSVVQRLLYGCSYTSPVQSSAMTLGKAILRALGQCCLAAPCACGSCRVEQRRELSSGPWGFNFNKMSACQLLCSCWLHSHSARVNADLRRSGSQPSCACASSHRSCGKARG